MTEKTHLDSSWFRKFVKLCVLSGKSSFLVFVCERMKSLIPACELFLVVGKPEDTLTMIGRVCEWPIFRSGLLNPPCARIGDC